MQTDQKYSHIKICPITGDQLTEDDVYRTNGVCPQCGDASQFVTHYTKIVGRWRRPSLFERIVQKKELKFFRKSEEDGVWQKLQQT